MTPAFTSWLFQFCTPYIYERQRRSGESRREDGVHFYGVFCGVVGVGVVLDPENEGPEYGGCGCTLRGWCQSEVVWEDGEGGGGTK
jgi:hypothetical protein